MIASTYEDALMIYEVIKDLKFDRGTRRYLRRKHRRNLVALWCLRLLAPDEGRRAKANDWIKLTRAYLSLLSEGKN